jgi:hypothetical protein
MTVQRAQAEALEVLFRNREPPTKVFQRMTKWQLGRASGRGSVHDLFLLGVMKTPTSRHNVAVFGLSQPDTEGGENRCVDPEKAYHCVVLMPGSKSKIRAIEIVPDGGVFASTNKSVEYIRD